MAEALRGWSLTGHGDSILSEDERRHVENMLDASGFPLEIEVSSFLEERNWTVAPSMFYQDLDQRKLREIDIIASKTCHEDLSMGRFDPYELALTLVIECKKSKKFNWVFYTRPIQRNIVPLPPWLPYSTGLLYTDFAECAKTRSLFSVMFPAQAILMEQQFGPQRGILSPQIARQLSDTQQMGIAHADNLRCISEGVKSIHREEVPRENRPNDLSVYLVARNLWKATWDEMTLTKRMMNLMFESLSQGLGAYPQPKWPIYLFLPIIIFDGPMWRWIKEEKRVERIDQVVLQVQLTSQNYPSPSALICVVHKNRAFQLITEIEEDLGKITDRVTRNVTKLNHERETIEAGIRFEPK